MKLSTRKKKKENEIDEISTMIISNYILKSLVTLSIDYNMQPNYQDSMRLNHEDLMLGWFILTFSPFK